ncbi:hypothetical protein ACTFIY_002641 [Dictyostelium cf. discoideum]
MSDWSDLQKDKWVNENREVEEVDAWDASSEDEVEEEVEEIKEPPKPVVKQLTKKQALQRAIELKEKELKEPQGDFDIYLEEKRKKELQEASDLENSKNLFSGLSVKESSTSEPISTFIPKTEKDFEQYSQIVSDYLLKYDSSIHYANFFKSLMKKVLVNVSSSDMNDISKTLTVVINEKLKNEKSGKGGNKTKTKVAPKKIHMGNELQNYDDFDDDDFM